MRRLLPLLALCLVHCADDPKPNRAPSDADGADDGSDDDGSERADAGKRDASVDARAPSDARIDAAARDAALDAQVVPRPDAAAHDADVSAPPGLGEPNAPVLTYLGTTGNDSTCTRELHSVGYAPKDGAKHPLFLYFVGTQFFAEDKSSYYDSLAAKRVTEAMSRRGFVAYGVEYDNLYTSFLADKSRCLYEGASSFLKKACALPNVDCNLGIATWGHSQGALVAHLASNYDDRVRAVWTTGYSGNTVKLPPNRLRVVNGEGDTMNSSIDTLNKVVGTTCTSGDSCLRDDGSGWIVVRKGASRDNNADHCWFDKLNCAQNTLNLEPNWIDPASTAPFALEKNADWVAATVKRP